MNSNKPKTRLYIFVALLIGGLLLGWELLTTISSAQQRVDFNRDIRPILSENCFTCHGPDDVTRKAKLRFDTKEGAFAKAGVIVAGNATNSRIIKRIVTNDPDIIMPPPGSGHQLTKAQIDLLTRWVNEGANWGLHWSFVTPQRPELPKLKDTSWSRNPIDYFVLARLEQEGLKPSPEADKATLLRRVTLDLTGLPPTQNELDEFLPDDAPKTYEKTVDRLLASPRFGERMAFGWLDAARYSDTHGYQRDGDRTMWRWRDWVIDAFNQNLPFDQFTIQQLAGDLLPKPTIEQRIATGFNRNHRANSEGGIVPSEYYVEYIVDRVDTTSTVFMGLTVGCARCHSHKYDPITHKDYYQLFAYFNSIPETGMIGDFGNARPWMAAPDRNQQQQLAQLETDIAQAEKQLSALAEQSSTVQRAWEKSLPITIPQQWFPQENLVLAYSMDEAAKFEIHKPPPPPMSAAPKIELAKAEIKTATSKSEKPGADKNASPAPKPTPAPTPVMPGFANGTPNYVSAPTGQGTVFDGKLLLNAEHGIRFGEVVRGKELKEKFAVSLWFYPQSEQSGALVTYLQDDAETQEIKLPKGRGFGLFFLDGKIKFNVVASWDEDSVKTETQRNIQTQQWHHLLAVFDAENALEHIQLFIDGQKEPLTVKQSSLFNNYGSGGAKLRIGGGGGSALRFKGQLDEVRIYKGLPEAAQIVTLACADTLQKIASIEPSARTAAQRLKIRGAFFDRYALAQAQPILKQLADLKEKRTKLISALPTVMVMQEMPQPRPTFVLRRGAYDAPGEKVERGVPAVLPPLPKEFPNNRLGLAKWLVSAEHPLTARVQVNRYWQMLFGTGLVKTVEDFGAQGESPSHPELLDWMATEFQSKGWNIKGLLKTIVMSATYRQSSKITPELLQRDPNNRLLAHGPRFRLSAEMLRDQALFASGLLVEKQGGPSVKTYQPADVYKGLVFGSTIYEQEKGEGLWRRSLYTYWKRTILTPDMLVLDATAREFCTVRETRTNTPLQALTLMNDVTFVEAARLLAQRMLIEGGTTETERFKWAFRQVVSRVPNETELNVLRENLAKQLAYFRRNSQEAVKLLNVGDKRNDTKLKVSELAAYTTIASLILNLNEAITRQ